MKTTKWTVMAATLMLLLAHPVSADLTWDGGGANALASNPTNWVGGMAPVAGDGIVLDATTNKNITWDLNIPIQSWTQVGYVGTVTVATVYGVVGFTNFNILGNCVMSNGVWTHPANSTNETSRLKVTIAGDLTIGAGAAMDVTGKGYAAGKGPGVGTGGSYGGVGFQAAGPCYGSIVAPTNLGSGGQLGSGGGAILLTVGGMSSIDGLVCADGAPQGDRVGSGGSIWLTSGALSGGGTIRANGGVSLFQAGGGGRVALVVTNAGANFSSFTGTNSAYGGYGTGTYGGCGGAGTVYLRVAGQGIDEGTMIVDNRNQASTFHADIVSNVAGTAVGHVLIRNNGYLLVCSNQNLVVSGIWSNGARFGTQFGSQVIFAGGASSTSTVYGTNQFMGLTCTNAGKTLLFQAGKTNKVSALGRLKLKGSETANVVLRSTTNDTTWKLNVDPAAAQVIEYVDVQDSDAMTGVGAEITAMNSQNSGNNQNWKFVTVTVGETNVWTGNSNVVWSARENWSLDRAPVEEDIITIPGGLSHYPVLDAAVTVHAIELASGASLALAGYDLTVAAKAVMAGTVTASGSEIITLQADADFTGGDFISARSTVLVAGAGDQTVNLGNLIFYRVTVLNNSGTVSFGNGFSATELRCEAPSGTYNLSFQQGSTVRVRDLILLGSVASTNIFLRSSVYGGKWNLAVTGYRWSVQGVDVQDSDASFGLPVPAVFAKNSGGNLNWLFDADAGRAVWLGTSNNNFHTAANWSSGVVPGATTRILVNATNPMTITGAVTVLDLTVGGNAGVATGTVNAALTVLENITVISNGTLVLNRPCVVSNSLYVLAGGLLTHSANSTNEVNKLNVTVYGNVGVDQNGVVNATGKGYAAGKGPGCGSTGSYGGAGTSGGPCYGSIVTPTNCGSGGLTCAGGGVIQLTTPGEIRNDGLMCSDGGSLDQAGSGGSIWLTSGTLMGVGVIRVDAVLIMTYSPGAGGRISLMLTSAGADFSGFTGIISAYGGNGAGSVNYGSGAGTVYKQVASDRPGRGTVWVDNNNVVVVRYTEMPPSTNYVPGEVDRATFYVNNAATLRLVNDFAVGDIWVPSANAKLDLGLKTLLVHSRQHTLAGSVVNYGSIIWMPDVAGTVFSIR